MRAGRIVAVLAVGGAILAPPASAASCVRVGVFQDNLMRSYAPLQKVTGKKLDTASVYITGGMRIDPRLIGMANRRNLTLVVTWSPDGGVDRPVQPKFRLRRVLQGRYDANLRALGRQLAGLKRPAIFRPMPEPNTPWHAWSGLVNGNTPAQYVAAFRRVRTAIKSTGRARVRVLWAPYARSVPESAANTMRAYFPGKTFVDLTGASAYNFGAARGLAWTEPAALFQGAYGTAQALAPGKKFWIAETGSTSVGGSKSAWISALGALPVQLPNLAGVVWYDVKEPAGDFRITQTRTTRTAFRNMTVTLARECR